MHVLYIIIIFVVVIIDYFTTNSLFCRQQYGFMKEGHYYNPCSVCEQRVRGASEISKFLRDTIVSVVIFWNLHLY